MVQVFEMTTIFCNNPSQAVLETGNNALTERFFDRPERRCYCSFEIGNRLGIASPHSIFQITREKKSQGLKSSEQAAQGIASSMWMSASKPTTLPLKTASRDWKTCCVWCGPGPSSSEDWIFFETFLQKKFRSFTFRWKKETLVQTVVFGL